MFKHQNNLRLNYIQRLLDILYVALFYEYLCFEKCIYKEGYHENIPYLYKIQGFMMSHIMQKCNIRCYAYLILEMGGTKFLEDKQRNGMKRRSK